MFNLKITKMKKLIYFLVSLFALIGFSMNVSAQDQTQNLGESHSFTVNANTNSDFVWGIYSTMNGTGISATFSDLVAASGNYIQTGETSNSANYTWTGIAAGTYYVVVKETTKGTGCATTRWTSVKINANAYDLLVENKDNGGAIVEQLTCMKGAARVFSKSETVAAMPNVLYYYVTLKNGAAEYSANWKFNYTLTVKDKAGNTLTPSSVTVIKADGTTETGVVGVAVHETATEATVTGLSKFIIKVSVDDNFSKTTGSPEDANIVADFAVTSIAVGPGGVAEASGASGANSFEYTRTTYPNTSAITVN